MGTNTCYINSSFQLLTTIPEFNNIFLTNEKYDNIIYIGETVNIITERTNAERIKKNQNMTQFFKDVEQIVKHIINGTNKKDVKQCFRNTVYKTLIGIPGEESGFQSARDLINNFINILLNLQVPQKSLDEKIKDFLNKIIINKTEIKRCNNTKEIKDNMKAIFNLLEIKADENTNLQDYINNEYNKYNLQEGLIEGCGNQQKIGEFPFAQLDSLNQITKCQEQVCGTINTEFCIPKNNRYYNEYLKKVINNDVNYSINAQPNSNCNGRKLEQVRYGDRIYGNYERNDILTPNKYVIITLPMELYGTYNRTLYINYQGKIKIRGIEYILQGSVFHTGGHYVYQTYDGIGGTEVINTFDDSSVLDGNAGYIGGNGLGRNTAILLYKRHDIDIKILQNEIKPSDEIINKVINRYCSYRYKIKIYGSIFGNPTNTSYTTYLTKYPNALLIINDNYIDSKTDADGGGNARGHIRNYNIYSYKKYKLDKPRIAGITTGRSSGKSYQSDTTLNSKLKEFKNITPKEIIDEEIKLIKYIIMVWGYTEIIYSSDIDGNIGTSVFIVPEDIKEYIKEQLLNLGTKCYFMKDGRMTKDKISKNKYINILN